MHQTHYKKKYPTASVPDSVKRLHNVIGCYWYEELLPLSVEVQSHSSVPVQCVLVTAVMTLMGRCYPKWPIDPIGVD